MFSKLHLGLSTLVFIFSAGIVVADPPVPPHYHWRNTNYPSHYVLYDFPTKTYIETVDCKPMWRFKEVSNALNTLTLFDASRGMTIQLTYDGMFLKEKGATSFTFYQKGVFDTRRQFSHNMNGTYTGALTKQHGCQWFEYLAGASSPSWRFKEVTTTAGYVDLFDASRNMTVRLNNDSMYLRTGTAPLAFFKKGQWGSN